MAALIRAASLTGYATVAKRAGLDPAAMLREAGLDSSVLSNPDLRIPVARVGALLERSAQLANCPTIGLQMVELRQISDFGALSLLLTHQRTLRDALTTLVEYIHLLNQSLAVHLEEAGDVVIVREEIVVDRPGSARQATELAVGVLFRMCRALLGAEWKPESVNFVHSAPTDTNLHRKLFGMKPVFGSAFSGMVCMARDLDRPNPSADPVMARYARQFVEAMPGVESRSISSEVRKAIYLLLPQGRATIEQVAQGLGTNVRTLQRHLDSEGEIFSYLLNGVRRDLVVRYLKNADHSLTEIAAMLGFSHSSAFSRWYATQFGDAPSRARSVKAR
jgi:AraC-like DNA-binding protein